MKLAIQDRINELQLSRMDLSKGTGLPYRTVEEIIKRNGGNLKNIAKIANFLEMTIDELIIPDDEEEDGHPPPAPHPDNEGEEKNLSTYRFNRLKEIERETRDTDPALAESAKHATQNVFTHFNANMENGYAELAKGNIQSARNAMTLAFLNATERDITSITGAHIEALLQLCDETDSDTITNLAAKYTAQPFQQSKDLLADFSISMYDAGFGKESKLFLDTINAVHGGTN